MASPSLAISLCHNICCLISAIDELGLSRVFSMRQSWDCLAEFASG
jgi:hypothetical protein